MDITKLKSTGQLIVVTFFIIITLIGGVMASLSLLKEEAVNSNIRLISLQADTFSENLSQSLSALDLLFDSIASFMAVTSEDESLQEQFLAVLKNHPHLRSLNLVEEGKIVLSTNPKNMGLSFDDSDFYPKPFFNQPLLRVGNVIFGRDFHEIYASEKESNLAHIHTSTFIPISKKMVINNKEYCFLLTLNPDYFISAFSSKLQNNAYVDILRADDTLLASSQKSLPLCHICAPNEILEKSKVHNSASGVAIFYNEHYLIASSLTPNYPFTISVRSSYDKSLEDWDNKRYDFFFITTAIVAVCVALVLYLLFLYTSKHQEELKRHKLQIKHQKKFEVLFESKLFLSAVVSKKGVIKEINQTALTFLNQSHEEVCPILFWNLPCFIHEDNVWLKHTLENYTLKQHIQKELTVLNAQNEHKVIELLIIPIENHDESDLILLSSDITQRKKDEYKIKEAYTVFQNTHDGIVVTDAQANIISVNKAFETCSGYALSEVLHKNPNILKSGVHDRAFYQAFWRQLEKEGFWQGELVNKRKNGELWSEWLTINAVYDEKKVIQNYIAVFHDTTEQKNHEKELKQKEDILVQQSKMASMGEMIENIAHQWRQPLSVISTIATGIQLKHEFGIFETEEVLKDLKTINTSAQFLSHTIDDFRNFLTKNKVSKIFEIDSAIEKALNILQAKFKNRDITLITNIEALEYQGFENELIQVFLNILNNAKDAFEFKLISERYIFIDAYKKDNTIIISIKDTAGGIKEEFMDKIFDPYFTTKHQSQGTGIGLYMSKQIIANHLNGELSAHNVEFEYLQKKYRGACFTLVLTN